MTKIIENDYIGKKFGELTIIEFVGKDKHYNRKVFALCSCGVTKEFFFSGIVRKNPSTLSCGCKRARMLGERRRKNGLSGHPLRVVYDKIKQRCYNASKKDYPYYQGKGVRMSDEWLNDFDLFYKWAIDNGWEPGKQIDKDKKAKELGVPALLYSAEMCTVLSGVENGRYASRVHWVKYNGHEKTIKEWAEIHGVNKDALKYRLKTNNWDMDVALKIIYSRKSKI